MNLAWIFPTFLVLLIGYSFTAVVRRCMSLDVIEACALTILLGCALTTLISFYASVANSFNFPVILLSLVILSVICLYIGKHEFSLPRKAELISLILPFVYAADAPIRISHAGPSGFASSHALLTRILSESSAPPTTWAPYYPELPLTYPLGHGYSTVAFSKLSGIAPFPAFDAHALIHASVPLAVFIFIREAGGSWREALLASIFPLFFIRYPTSSGLAPSWLYVFLNILIFAIKKGSILLTTVAMACSILSQSISIIVTFIPSMLVA